MSEANCSIRGRQVEVDGATAPDGCCPVCAGLLRWVRGCFAHHRSIPLARITRFVEELGVDSLDWMSWPFEAEEKLGVSLPDRMLERMRTVRDFLRALREAGAQWPDDASVRLLPRRGLWSPYRYVAEAGVLRVKPRRGARSLPDASGVHEAGQARARVYRRLTGAGDRA
jgi:acyl carrier protein